MILKLLVGAFQSLFLYLDRVESRNEQGCRYQSCRYEKSLNTQNLGRDAPSGSELISALRASFGPPGCFG